MGRGRLTSLTTLLMVEYSTLPVKGEESLDLQPRVRDTDN